MAGEYAIEKRKRGKRIDLDMSGVDEGARIRFPRREFMLGLRQGNETIVEQPCHADVGRRDRRPLNIDQEMANLLTLQNSYAATARVLSAVKDMIDTLMKI